MSERNDVGLWDPGTLNRAGVGRATRTLAANLDRYCCACKNAPIRISHAENSAMESIHVEALFLSSKLLTVDRMLPQAAETHDDTSDTFGTFRLLTSGASDELRSDD